MTEQTAPKTNTDKTVAPVQRDSTTEHTCACGEKHEQHAGDGSHQDACTSPMKFTDSCCCGSGEAANAARHRCGHGPRCQ